MKTIASSFFTNLVPQYVTFQNTMFKKSKPLGAHVSTSFNPLKGGMLFANSVSPNPRNLRISQSDGLTYIRLRPYFFSEIRSIFGPKFLPNKFYSTRNGDVHLYAKTLRRCQFKKPLCFQKKFPTCHSGPIIESLK